MHEAWISPNTITGDAATGTRYFRRNYLNEYFWREVAKGNHILFVAPRRVGKTSIMKDLAQNCPENYCCIYQDIEATKTKNEFYKRLFELILQCVNKSQKVKKQFGIWIKKYGIEEISKNGIKFKTKEIDYENEVVQLIAGLKDTGVHTIIFLDEFAEVIYKLKKNGHQEDAVNILHRLREMRSDEDFRHFTLVFAGSIGLEFVIKTIDRPKLINDLHRVKTLALKPEEADVFIQQITNGATIRCSRNAIHYLKEKINHLLPYYIQLMMEYLDLLARELNQPEITVDMIDESFNRVLQNEKNFEDWLERLKGYQKDHFPFINEILMHAAHKNQILVQEVFDRAVQFGRQHDYMDFIDQLLHDGYLAETAPHVYRFISPFLQQFWLKKFPVYHG
jgi:uncharacterized protein